MIILNKQNNKTLIITIATFILLIFCDMVANFKIFDVMYILFLIIYFVHYRIVKNTN